MAVEALRSPVEAIVVHPVEHRGELSIELRGDLAAFRHLADYGATSGKGP